MKPKLEIIKIQFHVLLYIHHIDLPLPLTLSQLVLITD